jgi:hypothetical protein
MKKRLLFALVSSASVLSAAPQRLEITANVPTEFTLPMPETPIEKIVMRGADGTWLPLAFQQEKGTLRFRVLPAKTGGRALLLIDPPADLVLDDRTAPRLLGLRIDKAVTEPTPLWRQAAGTAAPQQLSWEVADPENGIDPKTIHVALDGQPLPSTRLALVPGKLGRISIRVNLAKLPLGKHHLEAAMADRSPERNRLQLRAEFERFDPSNLLRGAPGVAKITVDSNYPSYDDLTPLTDGVRHLPGKGAGSDVTWASAENDSPHWVDFTLRKRAKISELTLYWARENSASRIIEVQIPKGDGWQTIHRADALPAKQCVELKLKPVTTSRFRIYQPSNGGSAERPGLLWFTEIEAR